MSLAIDTSAGEREGHALGSLLCLPISRTEIVLAKVLAVTCFAMAGLALATPERHAERVVRRWTSTYTNARMEGLNSLFQAARARARSYRTNKNFMTMIYMIASPAGVVLNNSLSNLRNALFKLSKTVVDPL